MVEMCKEYGFPSNFDMPRTFTRAKRSYSQSNRRTASCIQEESFSKLRMSAHNLEIEAGRFGKNRIPRSDRHCKFCLSLGTQVLGDEVHFVMVCPQF